MNIEHFKKLPVLGILRGITSSDLEPIIETSIQAGLKTIEIAINTPNAIDLIKNTVKIARKRLTIGAGTVLNKTDLLKVLNAGASFIVTPVLIMEVAKYCVDNKIPFFPGALTPSEIYTAWGSGATMVKVFPASSFGPAYFKEIKGPFDKIKLMAVGGVKAENVKNYLNNGADAVAFGAGIYKKEWIKNNDFNSIRNTIECFLEGLK